MLDHEEPSHARSIPALRISLIVLGSLIALGGAAYAAAYLYVGGGVLPHTTVEGVPVGRMSDTAAQAKVAAGLAPRSDAPITVTVAGQFFTLDPATAGLTVDTRATVAAGAHRSASPAALWKALFAHPKLDAAVSVDTAKLDAAVTALNAKIVGGGHDGGITFKGVTPVAIPPVPGIEIVHDKALAAIRAAYLSTSGPIALPVDSVQPSVTEAAVEHALTTIAAPAVAAPINIVVGTATLPVSPSVIAANLTFVSKGGALVPVVDGDGITAAIGSSAFAGLETPAKDASFDVKSGVPVIVPSVEGGTADLSALGSAIAGVLTKAAPRMISVPAKGIDPTFTTADAEKLGVKQMVSTFTTHHPCCAARVTNIHAIANIVNGAVVMPGATFSLNQFVGPRDTKRGFVEAPMIEDGLFDNSVGGGVSQFATTLYNAVFFAGLRDIDAHAAQLLHQPLSGGARGHGLVSGTGTHLPEQRADGDRDHDLVHRDLVDGDVLGHQVLRRDVDVERALRPDDDRHGVQPAPRLRGLVGRGRIPDRHHADVLAERRRREDQSPAHEVPTRADHHLRTVAVTLSGWFGPTRRDADTGRLRHRPSRRAPRRPQNQRTA